MLHGRPSFLLLYRAPHLMHADTWQAVHGMIDDGEKAYDAAWRECVEETGLTPERFFRTEYIETFYSEGTDACTWSPRSPLGHRRRRAVRRTHCARSRDLDDARRPRSDAVRLIAEATAQWPEVGTAMYDIIGIPTFRTRNQEPGTYTPASRDSLGSKFCSWSSPKRVAQHLTPDS
jgi:8-oxo-dGTP pyrophosphatase MutT (NUDIX family)